MCEDHLDILRYMHMTMFFVNVVPVLFITVARLEQFRDTLDLMYTTLL